MKISPGRTQILSLKLVALSLLAGFWAMGCGEQSKPEEDQKSVPSDARTRWLAKREQSRQERDASTLERSAVVPHESAAPVAEKAPVVPAAAPSSKEDFANRLSAIVGSKIESDKVLRQKAEGGDKGAQREFGRSIAAAGNYEEAAKWYRKAADQGDADAQHDLAALYVMGMGVEQDIAEAVRLFALSAAQGNIESQYSLGLRYLKGDHVQQDFAESVKWFQMAATQGNADSQLSLARRYVAGEGVAKDLVEAYKWATLSDANGKWGAAEVQKSIATSMTPEQIADGKRRVAAFVPAKAHQ